MSLTWTAWNNGKHHDSGAGYGLKVPIADRNHYFSRECESVTLELPTQSRYEAVTINVSKKSFWTPTCHELISKDVGVWFRRRGLAPWQSGHPPRFEIEVVGKRNFRVVDVAR